MTEFRGWHVLGASFITAMLMAGATFYSFQHFVTPIEAEFGLKRDQVNLGMVVFLLSSALWGGDCRQNDTADKSKKIGLSRHSRFCDRIYSALLFAKPQTDGCLNRPADWIWLYGLRAFYGQCSDNELVL